MSLLNIERLNTLVASNWIAVEAMPVQNNQRFLFDIVIVTVQKKFCMIAKDTTLPSGDDMFSLALEEFTSGGWWKDVGIGINSEWKPRHIKNELVVAGHSAILTGPRRCRVFTNTELVLLDHTAEYVAVEFATLERIPSSRLVLRASNEFPCTLELAILDIDCNGLLSGLVELPIQWTGADSTRT